MASRSLTYLYRLFDRDDVLLYVGITVDLGQRWKRHMKEKSWWGQVHHMTTEVRPSWEDARRGELTAIIQEYPVHNMADVPVERRLARDLARMLREGTVPAEPGMTALLRGLAGELTSYLARVPEEVNQITDELERRGQAAVPVVPQCVVGEVFDPDAEEVLVHPGRIRMRELMAARGDPGYQVKYLVAALDQAGCGVARQTVHAWLVQADGSCLAGAG